jgi:hypothetical protein
LSGGSKSLMVVNHHWTPVEFIGSGFFEAFWKRIGFNKVLVLVFSRIECSSIGLFYFSFHRIKRKKLPDIGFWFFGLWTLVFLLDIGYV